MLLLLLLLLLLLFIAMQRNKHFQRHDRYNISRGSFHSIRPREGGNSPLRLAVAVVAVDGLEQVVQGEQAHVVVHVDRRLAPVAQRFPLVLLDGRTAHGVSISIRAVGLAVTSSPVVTGYVGLADNAPVVERQWPNLTPTCNQHAVAMSPEPPTPAMTLGPMLTGPVTDSSLATV